MPFVSLVIALIAVGVALSLINMYVPMAASIKAILNIVVIVAVGVWVLRAVGVLGEMANYRIGG